ncbi:TetR/AcrR family transcriptional regulator [Parabacteroides sp. OttesenSCG-928-G07]|nr:TetR/AcrR family transcriptional regulator [Parabacteroides sp. OttesenSCG-928-G07]
MADSKQQILQTALKLFLRSPYKEVSLRDIVDEVGLTKGAFYHHYISKEELFVEVVKYFYNNVMITDYRNFPKTSLKEFYEHYLRMLLEPGENDNTDGDMNFFLFVSEASKRVPDFKNIHLAQRKKELWAWAEIMSIAKSNKEIKTNISDEELAFMFLNISDGISMNRAFNGMDGMEALEAVRKDWDNLYAILKK